MSLSKLFRPRILISIGLILIVAVVAFGYAAANAVPESGAGDGDGVVSGYDIENITYTLLDSDPTKVELVGFDVNSTTALAGAATDVRITVDGTTWVTCVDGGPPAWTCTFTPASEPTVLLITNLQVVAVQ